MGGRGQTKRTVIVGSSANADETEINSALGGGFFDGFIPKPVTTATLKAKLDERTPRSDYDDVFAEFPRSRPPRSDPLFIKIYAMVSGRVDGVRFLVCYRPLASTPPLDAGLCRLFCLAHFVSHTVDLSNDRTTLSRTQLFETCSGRFSKQSSQLLCLAAALFISLAADAATADATRRSPTCTAIYAATDATRHRCGSSPPRRRGGADLPPRRRPDTDTFQIAPQERAAQDLVEQPPHLGWRAH